MDQERHLLFPPFRLGPVNDQLWRQEEQVTLRRKTFEVLHYLVKHPGRLVTKAALLEAVWKEVVVSDSLPAVCVGELRRLLGFGAQEDVDAFLTARGERGAGTGQGDADQTEHTRAALEAAQAIRQISRGVRLGGLKIKDLINEGRRWSWCSMRRSR
jgi:hypothetical protein